MRILGLLNVSVSRIKKKAYRGLSAVAGSWMRVFDWIGGYFQADDTMATDEACVQRNWAVFSCVTLIADYIGKFPAAVMQYNPVSKIFDTTRFRPVLRKPNRYQTRIEFVRMWVCSLLLNGNTYVLLERGADGFVVAMHVLDPCRVVPLVAPDGSVFYQLNSDNLAAIDEQTTVPASEVIHDRINTLFHPLIGLSPIFASGIAAMQAQAIQKNSKKFFENMSRPSGVLSAPGSIAPDVAERIKTAWETKFSGDNAGKVAVLGDGLEYTAMTINATDSQLIEQLKFTGEMICATFHVPPYKLGLGQMPTVNNTAALNQQMYDQCLQPIVENMELRLAEGLDLAWPFEVWMDESVMMRMDPSTRLKSHADSIRGSFLAPNEARRIENWGPVEGGDSPLSQQQNYSLAALAKRDAKDDPFGKSSGQPSKAANDDKVDAPSPDETKAYLDDKWNRDALSRKTQ